ncbi:MAG: tetratricopeptide repeat protein [Saprospiraceae bacterium]|nr:tetratricopeptide repeat protein [Saprospiraceae bacterium]
MFLQKTVCCLLAISIWACTEKSADYTTDQQRAKSLYREVIGLRFEKPDQAMILADSILAMHENHPLDTFRIAALVQKSLLLSEKRNMPEALKLAELALEEWKPQDGIFARCKALEQLGQCYIVLKDYNKARGFFEAELALAPKCGEKALGIESFAASYLGDVAEKQGKWEESIQYHEKAVNAATQMGGGDLVGGAYHSMAVVFHTIGDFTHELECLKKAAVSFEATDYRRAASYINISALFESLKMPDSADHYMLKAYQMPELPPQIKVVTMVSYAGTLTRNKQLAEARSILQEAMVLADTIGDRERLGIALNQMGETYAAENKFAIALNYSMMADSVLRDSLTEAAITPRYEAARNVVRMQLLHDQHRDIVLVLDQMAQYRDSISSAEYLKVIDHNKHKVQSDSITLLSSHNQLQASQIETSNLLLTLIGIACIMFAGLAFVWRQNFRLTQENIGMLDEQNQKLAQDNFQLKQSLEEIRSKHSPDQQAMLEQTVALPTRNNLTLKLKEIIYVQAFGGGVYYVTPEKKHLVWHGFEESQKMLPEEFFVKTHRSYIINKTYVEQISTSKVFLKNGEVIPIGVTLKDEVRERLGAIR